MLNFECEIVTLLLKKYYKRIASNSSDPFKRRIDISIKKIFKNYDSFDVSLTDKLAVNAAIQSLVDNGFIRVPRLKYSDDIEKIILNLDTITDLENYAFTNLGITPRRFLKDQLMELINRYDTESKLVNYYITQLKDTLLMQIVILI